MATDEDNIRKSFDLKVEVERMLREANDERGVLQSRLLVVSDTIAGLEAVLGTVNRYLASDRQIGSQLGPAREPGGRSVIKPAVAAILKGHAPEAIHADQVVAELRERGVPLSHKDPKATAVTAMLRMDRDRRMHHSPSGIERLPGNMFRWIEATLRPDDPNEPKLPFGQSQTDAPESTLQPEPFRP
jgi:hypothetical protein